MAKEELLYTHSYATNETGNTNCFGVVYAPPEPRHDIPTQHWDYLASKGVASQTQVLVNARACLKLHYGSMDVNLPISVKDHLFYLKHCLKCEARHRLVCDASLNNRHRSNVCRVPGSASYEELRSTIHYPHYEISVPCNTRNPLYRHVRLGYPLYSNSRSKRITTVGLCTGSTNSSGVLTSRHTNRQGRDYTQLMGRTHLKHIDRLVYASMSQPVYLPQWNIVSPSGDNYTDLCNIGNVYESLRESPERLQYLTRGSLYSDYSTRYSYHAPENTVVNRVYVRLDYNRVVAVYVDCDDKFTELLTNTYFLKKTHKVKKCNP